MMDRKAFNDIVSVFEYYTAKPVDVPLIKWLAACKKGGKFKDQVLQYRDTGAQELKKSLPHVTVGAAFTGKRNWNEEKKEHEGYYRVPEQIYKKTGWISLDIDGKENPQIKDFERTRDEIFKISNIAFAGLSTGGKGVWALVKVSDPNNQKSHFQALKKDFEELGITLDGSKGENANDARYYSYDPNARIKYDFEIYTKKHVPQPATRKKPVQNTGRSSYGEAALQKEIGVLAMAREGTRNETLFKCSASLFELVAGGELDMIDTENVLHDTALRIGLSESETRQTIASGKQNGLSNPRSAKKKSAPPTPRRRNVKPKKEYPRDWDEVKPPMEGTHEAREAEYYAARDADVMLSEIEKTFDAVLTP